MPEREDDAWFGRTESGIGVGPRNWKGRAVLMGWVLLTVIAVVTYSTLGITIFVVAFYSAIVIGIVAVKSDLLDEYRSGRH